LVEGARNTLRKLTAALGNLADETRDPEDRDQIRAVNGKAIQALGILNTAGQLPGLPPIPRDQGDG
jgi:hypothetical protein